MTESSTWLPLRSRRYMPAFLKAGECVPCNGAHDIRHKRRLVPTAKTSCYRRYWMAQENCKFCEVAVSPHRSSL